MHNIQAEQALIGAILFKNDLFSTCSAKVDAGDFFEPLHQMVWEICGKLIAHGKLANAVTVQVFIPKDWKFADHPEKTVSQYVAGLAAEGATANEAPHLAEMLRHLSDRRKIGQIAAELQIENADDPGELAAWGIEQLDAIVASRTASTSRPMTLDESMARAMQASSNAYKADGALTGIPFGLRDLDKKLNGAQPTDLIVIGGRPSQGKTTLAMSAVRSMAQAGYRGYVASLEMNDVQLSTRMISDYLYDHAGRALSYANIGRGNFREEDFQRIRDAGMVLKKLPVTIDQTPSMTVGQIASRARQMKQRGGLDFLVVDQLSQVKSTGRYNNRSIEIGEITGSLKALAKSLEIPVILMCQLSRGVEGREDKRPTMSDLRDSGNIEQDADVVMMVYREAYYLERKEPQIGTAEHQIWSDRFDKMVNRMDVLIEKQRMGPIGAVQTFCDIKCNAIRDQGYAREAALYDSRPDLAFAF